MLRASTIVFLAVACSDPPRPFPSSAYVHHLVSADGRTATAEVSLLGLNEPAPAGATIQIDLVYPFGAPPYCSLRAGLVPTSRPQMPSTGVLQGVFDRPCVRPAGTDAQVFGIVTYLGPDGRSTDGSVESVPTTLGGDGLGPEERMERERLAQVASRLAQVDVEIAKLPALAAAVPDAAGVVADLPCPPDLPRPSPRTYPPRIELERLARIARAVAARTPPDPAPPDAVGWEFMSGTALDWVAARLRAEPIDENAVLRELSGDPLQIVTRSVRAEMPRLVAPTTESAAGSYVPGVYVGAVFVLDRATNRVLCQAPVRAESAASIVFDAQNVGLQARIVEADFQRQVRHAVDESIARIAPPLVEVLPL